MSQDIIADLLSSLRNAYAAGKREARMPFSAFSLELIKILVEEGYLTGVKRIRVRKGVDELLISLNRASSKKEKVISKIKRISKPSVRWYVSAEDLVEHNRRLGIVIISTSDGLMTTKKAAKKNLGGELVCRVW